MLYAVYLVNYIYRPNSPAERTSQLKGYTNAISDAQAIGNICHRLGIRWRSRTIEDGPYETTRCYFTAEGVRNNG